MSLQRKAFRKFIVDLLKRKKTAAGQNIIGNRSSAVWQENLPAIMVYPRSEDITERSQSPRELRRDAKLVIEVVVAGKDDEEAADNLDDLLADVERILSPDDSLDCTVDSIILTGVEFDYEDEAETAIASGRLVYTVVFYQFSPEDRRDQETIDFKSINAKWDVNTANDPDPEATDTINLPQV